MVAVDERKRDELRRRYGERVRYLRKERGVSQEKLAELTGLDRTYVSQVERGLRNSTIIIVYAISAALGVSLGDFFDEM